MSVHQRDYRQVDIMLRGVRCSIKSPPGLSKYNLVRKLGRLDFLRRAVTADVAYFDTVYYSYLLGGGKKRQRILHAIMHVRQYPEARRLALQRIRENELRYAAALNAVAL